jgi:flagellar motor component MotA
MRRQKMSDTDTIRRRYDDAYTVAKDAVAIGGAIKVVGTLIGAVIVLAGLLASDRLGTTVAVICGVVGIIGGVLIYAFGVLVTAQGQMHHAVLDIAVNTTPIESSENRKRSNKSAVTGLESKKGDTEAEPNHEVSSEKTKPPFNDRRGPSREPWLSAFCHYCGEDVAVGTVKCPSCGKEL